MPRIRDNIQKVQTFISNTASKAQERLQGLFSNKKVEKRASDGPTHRPSSRRHSQSAQKPASLHSRLKDWRHRQPAMTIEAFERKLHSIDQVTSEELITLNAQKEDCERRLVRKNPEKQFPVEYAAIVEAQYNRQPSSVKVKSLDCGKDLAYKVLSNEKERLQFLIDFKEAAPTRRETMIIERLKTIDLKRKDIKNLENAIVKKYPGGLPRGIKARQLQLINAYDAEEEALKALKKAS